MEINKKIKKIKRISIISNQDVYDITVNNTHNFFANGTLVHNCVEIGFYPSLDINMLSDAKLAKFKQSPEYKDGKNLYNGWQACNLCEINMKKVKTAEDFRQVCRAGAFIGTLQADYTKFKYLGLTSQYLVEQEALIGVSMTGMMDSPEIAFDPKVQRDGAKQVLDMNAITAKHIGINVAARGTCVKPAGCLDTNQEIKTVDGNKTILSIFEDQGFTLKELQSMDGEWLDLKSPVQIYNENNELENISKLYVNGNIEVYEIPMEDGSVIKCTPWHKFKLVNGDWKRADELDEGDDILNFDIVGN